MKNILNKKHWSLLGLLALLICTIGFVSCEDNNDTSNSPMNINAVYLEDAQSSVPDRKVDYARLGQTLRLEGSGFSDVQKIHINGRNTYFNATFVTNNNIIVQISRETPTVDASPEVRNKIVLEKNGTFYEFEFEIRAAAPTITNISHTLPKAGEIITIYGVGLYDASSVTFPGDIVVDNGITTNEEGTEVTVTVPYGITESGSVLVIAANGGAYSPACFNYKQGIVHNFDDIQNYSWGFISSDTPPLTAVIPASGNFPKSQGGYQIFNANGNLGANVDQRYWLNSGAISGNILNHISGSTSTADCGMQMDIYVEGVWNSGIIRFVMGDGWGTSRYCMTYQPVYINGAYDVTAFENPGCWFTITFPFSLSADYQGKTLDDVVANMLSADYKQSGPFFENTGIVDVFESVSATGKVYFDNIRFVLLTTPAYSDYPENEE